MKDGNKESTKELLSTFRSITAISLSLLTFCSNRSIFPLTSEIKISLFFVSFTFLSLCIAISVYICLIVIPKFLHEEENIINQDDVRISPFISMACFTIGCIVLLVIQNL